MDWVFLAKWYVIIWAIMLTTLAGTGFAKWIWHIIATSTEEAIIESISLRALEKFQKNKNE